VSGEAGECGVGGEIVPSLDFQDRTHGKTGRRLFVEESAAGRVWVELFYIFLFEEFDYACCRGTFDWRVYRDMFWRLAMDRRHGIVIEMLEEGMAGRVRRLGLRVLVRPGYFCISSAVVFTIGEMNLRIFNTSKVKCALAQSQNSEQHDLQ